MTSTSSKIGLASICPRAVWLRYKYGAGEKTEIMKKGTMKHELFAKDVESAVHVRAHRSSYVTALLLLLLIIFGLGFLIFFGILI